MGMIDKNFENLLPDAFRSFLRALQKNPYNWPNVYLAWEKPDGSLLMVGIKSTQMYHVIVHEVNPNAWDNKSRASRGEPLEYSSVLCGISPSTSYVQDGVRYDPVERLVDKVAECKYLGYWQDPDVLMDDPYAYNRVMACGRFELAKEKIGVQKELDGVIANAKRSAAALGENASKVAFGNRVQESGEEIYRQVDR